MILSFYLSLLFNDKSKPILYFSLNLDVFNTKEKA